MSRLIDADKLIEDLEKIHITVNGMRSGKSFTIDILERYEEEIKKTINNQPTAYDVDKVVGKLKHRRYMLFENLKQVTSYSYEDEIIENIRHYEYAINIVKAGGIDD